MKSQIERFALKQFLARLPGSVLVRMGGGKPVVREGRTLHPLLQAMMYVNRNAPGFERFSPAEARKAYRDVLAIVEADALPMADIRNERVPVEGGSIRVRTYTPPDVKPKAKGPAIVYFHGGGHVIGDIDDYDNTVRYIATRVGCRLINVEYRCAPEHKFPGAAEDAIAAFRWVQQNAGRLGINPARLAVMGDSAGGNLAAVVAMAARDRDFPPPKLQCLIYPMTDLRQATRSYTELGEGFGLTRAVMAWFIAHYVRSEADYKNPLGSPLLAKSHANLAPAIITVAGFDPLHDEGIQYAEKLRTAGVPVTLLEHDDLTHAWVTMTGAVPPARAAMDETCALVRKALKV